MEHFSFNDLPQAVQEISVRLVRVEDLLLKKQPPPQTEITKPYTLLEAAKFCRMPLPTFRANLSKRKVSGSKLGKRWVFQQSDLDKFLQKYHYSTSDEIQEGVDKALRSQRRMKHNEVAIKPLNR